MTDIQPLNLRKIDVTKPTTAIVKLCGYIEQLDNRITSDVVALGAIWSTIQSHELWRHYATHIETFKDFCREMGKSYSTVRYYIRVHEQFKGLLLTGVSFKHLTIILPLVEHKDEQEKVEWIGKARALPEQALKNEVREALGKVASDNCDHADTEAWRRCKKCNKFLGGERYNGK